MKWLRLSKAMLSCLSLFAISNCIEPYTVAELTFDYDYLVVEGALINSTDTTVIHLSRTSTVGNKSKAIDESNALVRIEEENGSSYSLSEHSNGEYQLAPQTLNYSKRYRLFIRTKDKKEYASDFIELRKSPSIDQLQWEEQPDGIQVYIDTRDNENNTWYYLWTFEETWKYSSQYYSNYKFENDKVIPRQFSDELYYCFQTIRSPDLYVYSTKKLSADVVSKYPLYFIPIQSRKLVYAYSLDVSQIAITKEAFEYWSALLKNNKQVGTLFDALPSQDIGNLHCLSNPSEPVLGYFSASSTTHKRIFIDRQEITGPSGHYDSSGYEDCQEVLIELNQLKSSLQGKLIIENHFNSVTQILDGYIISTKECIDCRLHGGTLNKPDFWK